MRLRFDYWRLLAITIVLRSEQSLLYFWGMSEHHLHSVPFALPRGYSRTFIFDEKASGFREKLTIDEGGIHYQMDGEPGSRRTLSLCLDWIAESIAAVRREVGA